MPDETLRLPNTIFQAVFDLGDKRAAKITLPPTLREPEIFAEWQDDENVVSLYVGYDDGQLHLDLGSNGGEHHFHGANGDASENSPWNAADTAALLAWSSSGCQSSWMTSRRRRPGMRRAIPSMCARRSPPSST
jgi:hypothetical protein